jgi:Flp pilus assembly pilin Flp
MTWPARNATPADESHARSERGATLTEYALMFGLVVIVVLAGIDRLSDGARDELSSRGETAVATGEPVGDLTIGSPPTSATTLTPPTTPAGDVVAANVEPIQVTATSAGTGNKWNMSVLITVVDTSTGEPLEGAVITGSFEGDTRSCTTDATGTCPLTRERIAQGTTTMSFTLQTVVYENASGAPPPAITFPPQSTVTANQP